MRRVDNKVSVVHLINVEIFNKESRFLREPIYIAVTAIPGQGQLMIFTLAQFSTSIKKWRDILDLTIELMSCE